METLHLVNKGYRDAMYLVGAIDKKLASGWSLTRRDPLRKYIVNRLRPILAEVEGLNLDEMVEELSKTAAAQ
ncbi:MAG: hypothetical protein K0S38_770 [Candidatus Paceibacter sp.]|nr:hypothetical protein [Candidatus Paceibacter sp.]